MDQTQELPVLPQGPGRSDGLPGASTLAYPPLPDHWDEMALPDGTPRAHWQSFVERFSTLPANEIQQRWERARRLLRENGVTYNVYGDPEGLDRPWRLDPLPVLLPAEEWRAIEAAVIQRAILLDQVIADLYGEQKLIAEGLLPPALIFANSSYLRPLHGIMPQGGTHLHLYAADIARGADGRWQVVADRTEAPSGVGYALENRSIIARTLADMMRTSPVEPLTPFLHGLRDALMALSPRRREAPRLVLLTPGPHNESFFEHAYLARHLGFTLVEGEDLTMREGCVFLKTLDGLQRVDVILRRTDATFCDPVELRTDSVLGIPGLVQAVRAGTVVVANALGSGVIEGGLLGPFLPAIARHILKEDLKIPSTQSWWCGDEKAREHVIANLGQLVVKRAFPGPKLVEPVFGEQLNETERAELTDSIRRHPYAYLAQEKVTLSTAPVWDKGAIGPRQHMLRVFAAAHDGGYMVMPGGLDRVSLEAGGSMVSMQQGGGSKDSWVMGGARDRRTQASAQVAPVRLVRGARDLPSRVADNLYWLGRYMERCEDTTRLLRAALSRSGAEAGFGAAAELPVALTLLRRLFRFPPSATPDEQAIALAHMNFDANFGAGLRAMVDRAQHMAAVTRDRLSLDTSRAVTRLQEVARSVESEPGRSVEEFVAVLNNLVLACEALAGLTMENMTRGPSWRFVDIGRRIERGVHVLDLLSGVIHLPLGVETPVLEVLLDVSDSAMTYRSRYLSTPQFAPVLDLLLADESNPRSLAFQTAALAEHIDQLAAARRGGFLGPEQRLAVWLTGAVRTAELDILTKPDEDGGRHNLATFIETLQSKLWELSETVTREYFAHTVRRLSAASSMGDAAS